MSAILSEIERAKRNDQIAAWTKAESAMAERLTEKLAAKFSSRERAPITEAVPVLTDDEQELWQDFVSYCGVEGVRHLPCRPSSCASYLLDRKLTSERMLDTIAAITKMHDRHALPNPTATAAVRSVLELEIESPPPRPWRRETKQVWTSLPADVRYEVARVERERELGFNRLWQKQAEYTKQLKAQLNDEKPNEVIKSIQDISQPRAAAAE
jgi:hypothetical protein